jgi:hypothetical protein
MANLYLVYDADHAGRLIGNARMHDDAAGLARISNLIDSGNDVFKSWAIDHGGAQISAGGDEGVLEIPATALMDLQDIKLKYEALLDLTVSIGVGLKMSQAFKALLASKLRGRNRTTMYDKEVEQEIEEASKSEDSEKEKIVKEYLEKRQPIHHVGSAGKPQSYHVQEKSANPEMQQAQDIKDMPAPPEDPPQENSHFETSFRNFADDDEKKEQTAKAAKSEDLKSLKQKVAQSLASMHKQLPMLAQIKQASPETYTAVLGVVQGLIAIGRQISDTEQQLSKGQVNIYHNTNLPPAGMVATSTGGFENYDLGMDKADLMAGGLADKKRPEDFDQEQLAIGQTIEAEHTDNPDLAREIAMDHLTEDPDYYKQELVKQKLKEEELDPAKTMPPKTVLNKYGLPEGIYSMRHHNKLVPGEIVSSRHIVVKTPKGNNSIRQVAEGMVREPDPNVVNPIGPGEGNVTSARNQPKRKPE